MKSIVSQADISRPAAFFCEQYQVSRTTWWRWAQMPGFPEPIRIGRTVRWRVAEVGQFLEQQRAA